ncbi:MAG: hypothetical protein ACLSBB_12230 [Ruthenibacterium lactatiformans]
MAGLVVLSYLILSNQLLGVGNARWFGSGRYTAFAMFAIFVVTAGAGYLVWRSYRDAQSFDALLRQLDIAARATPRLSAFPRTAACTLLPRPYRTSAPICRKAWLPR